MTARAPRFVVRTALLLAALCIGGPAFAQAATTEITRRDHSIRTTQGELQYTARALETVITNRNGEPSAQFMSWGYFAEDVGDPNVRPITFFFNGGPGSASLWLHMGMAAPKRVPAALATFGPGERVDEVEVNPFTLLTDSDLVFVDPVGTGFSEALGEYDDDEFWGVMPDAASVTQLVVRLLEDLERPHAPIFLAGESYGAIRAVTMLDVLEDRWPEVDVAGVILVSPALDTNVIVGGGRIAPYATRLPTYAALALFHGSIDAEPDDLWGYLNEVKEFALGEYTEALAARHLDRDARDDILERLEAYTGIARRHLARNGLKANRSLFTQTLGGGDEGLYMGSLDARYLRRKSGRGRETPNSTFNSALRQHLHDEFGIDTQGNYTTFSGRANGQWRSYDGETRLFHGEMRVVEGLERALERDPTFEIYVACGIYDLVTPFASAHALLNDGQLDQDRVTISDFEAGHMVYLHEESFERINLEVREFVRDLAAQEPAVSLGVGQDEESRERREATVR